MIHTLYKKQDGQTLILIGNLSVQELAYWKHEGYREEEPQVNKHGIRVVNECI